MKKFLFLILALFIMVAGLLFYSMFRQPKVMIPVPEDNYQKPAIENADNDTEPKADDGDVEASGYVSIEESGEGYSISVQYPRVASADANDLADETVQAALTEFRDNMAEYPPVEGAMHTYEAAGNEYSGGGVGSLVISEQKYSGGAHPSSMFYSVNWDEETGELVNPGDVFGPYALGLLSSLVRPELIEQGFEETDDWFMDGTAPTQENYDTWWIDGVTLFVQFQAYQIAPYVMGPLVVELPLSEVL